MNIGRLRSHPASRTFRCRHRNLAGHTAINIKIPTHSANTNSNLAARHLYGGRISNFTLNSQMIRCNNTVSLTCKSGHRYRTGHISKNLEIIISSTQSDRPVTCLNSNRP